MFRSKKIKTKTPLIGNIKDWRDSDHELEVIGNRLDQARAALKECKTPWARDFWATTADRLFTKWTLILQLKDTGMRQQGPSSFYSKIDYYWWEKSEEIKMVGFTWFEGLYENAGLQDRLGESWAKSKEQKLEKARQGLA
jgi:hypothetical protein